MACGMLCLQSGHGVNRVRLPRCRPSRRPCTARVVVGGDGLVGAGLARELVVADTVGPAGTQARRARRYLGYGQPHRCDHGLCLRFVDASSASCRDNAHPTPTRKRRSRPVRQSAQPRHADQFDCFFEVAVWRLGVSARAHNLGTSQPPVPSHIGTRVILAVSVGIDITPLETKTNIRVGLIRWSMPGLDHLRKDNLSKCRLSNHVSQRG